MKSYLLIFLFTWMVIYVSGQSISEILAKPEIKMSVYKPSISSGKELYLQTAFGSAAIANPSEVKSLANAEIASVDIVFSDYPKGKDFQALTKKRIENLKKLNPTLFQNKNIQWRLIRQTQCADQEAAKKLFHGIVIVYRPVQSKESAEAEVKYLKDLFSGPTFSVVSYAVKTDLKGKVLDSIGISSEYPIWTSNPLPIKDSTVSAVFRRHPSWTNMIIAADLTGSMSPYTAQLLTWLQLKTSNGKVKQFVFFNDGDRTPDHKKVIGKTGGIYDTRSSKFEDVQALAYKTMMRGGGGDVPENDLEALLKGISLCPECKDIILIADNWAPIKDIELLSLIKKPIKVILCGADFGINPQYLDLARATGGSVHTMRDDLTELMKLNEGQTFTIRGQTFKVQSGRFVKITKI